MWLVLPVGQRLLFHKTLNSQKITENHKSHPPCLQPPSLSALCIRRFQYVSQIQICVTTLLIVYGGKKATETVMQLCKCIMQKRIQLSRCHTRQTYYRIPAKDAQDTSGLRPEFCWQQRRVLLPAVRSSSSQISGKRNKPTLIDGVTVTRVL